MKNAIIILLTTFLLFWSFTNPSQNSLQHLETDMTASGLDESRAINSFQPANSMIHVLTGENQSVDVFLGVQENLTWSNVGLSTIINLSPTIENKIDANLLNLTGLIVKDYIHNNQTDIIISFSTSNTPLYKTNGWSVLETLFNETYALYMSGNAFSSMRFLAVRLNYSTIFELAQNPLVSHIWLDRKFHVCLDQSVRIIKDPLEWANLESSFGRRINGSSVKIAILDTGIDSTHPDFSFPNGTSKIVNAISFTSESTIDGFGHGTHCASIAAGTGAASAGQYVGVAPDALLMNVKVLDNTGEGLESWIISGIQWAVDNNAKILSMSFGAIDGGNESDPLSTTVNWATNQGVVCVVAAGNSGSQMYTITSPGVTELAITVGASTKNDLIPSFSSRGPTSDNRIKPDIVAPGVDIVAARASNTFMGTSISQYYTRASGTSMATPHVAGAVALLLDAHPSWTPNKIKRALTNYAQDINSNVFDQGSGRLDVCRAANASIIGDSSISFGRVHLNIMYRRTVSFQNLDRKTISATLNIATWYIGDGTPYNVASLNTSSLTLSNGATGNVELDLNIDGALPNGYFEGKITVIAGDLEVRIPFFFYILSQLGVKVTDTQGSPLMALFVLINAETLVTQTCSESHYAQFIMPAGNYIIQAMNVYAWHPSGGLDTKTSFILHEKFSAKTDETIFIQLSLASAYKLTVRSTGTDDSPLYLVMKQIYTLYGAIGYLSEIGTLTSQYIYLTSIGEYMKSPCFFGFAGFPRDYNYWTETRALIPEVNAYFIGWDLSTFGLSTIPDALSYINSELATFNIDIMLPKSSATSMIWFNQLSGMWQNGFWYGYQTNPGIRWKAHILPYQYKANPSTSWSDLEWSCIYTLSKNPMESPEYYVIDRNFHPISKGENSSYQMGKTPILPQIVDNNASYYGNGLFIPYYPLLVDGNLFIAKTDPQAMKRVEVVKDDVLIYNKTKPWAQEPIAISQFLKSNGYGLYSFTVKTETSFNCSSQGVAEYTINYTSTSTDLIPPSITKISCEPCFTGNEYQVEVQLADNDEISNVSLFYSTDNSPYLSCSLGNLGNDCFSADLILPAGTQKLSLIIEASDENGNRIQFKVDPACVRGCETQIGANLNGNRIMGELTLTGESLLQPVYLKVKSKGKIMYTLTDAYGNFAFSVPSSFSSQIEIEMSTIGTYHGFSLFINFLKVQTEPADVVSISGEGWYVEGTDVVLMAPEYVDASVNTRYWFSYWDVDGVPQGSKTNPVIVSMNATHTATAHYTPTSLIQHDIAITDVTALQNIVGQGFSTSINVTVTNRGDYLENFNITVYANQIIISMFENTILTSGDSKTITLTWSTSGFTKGNYTISAYAEPVSDETDTTDNTLSTWIIVTIPGDVNADGRVDIFDAVLLASAAGSKPGDKNWNANTDINGDFIVDLFDAVILADHTGQKST
jgi:subtilisin family serine protease